LGLRSCLLELRCRNFLLGFQSLLFERRWRKWFVELAWLTFLLDVGLAQFFVGVTLSEFSVGLSQFFLFEQRQGNFFGVVSC
jgi:hypothetical protein